MLCNVDAALKELGISEEYRALLRKAGIPVLCRIGKIDIGLTDELAKFFKELPELGQRPSAARKARHLRRKSKGKTK